MRNFLIILIVLLISACAGIPSYSFRGGEIPGETFSIESFSNSASIVNPNLSISLQDAMQKRFTNESNLKYTNGIGDAHFIGMITKYAITPVQGTGSETVALNRLTISLKITYANSVSGEQDFDKTFTSYDDFESTEDFNNKEEDLVESISEKLVALVYNQVLVDW